MRVFRVIFAPYWDPNKIAANLIISEIDGSDPWLNNITFPVLTRIEGNLQFYKNSRLVTLNFPMLTSIAASLWFQENENLCRDNSLGDFSALTHIGDSLLIDVRPTQCDANVTRNDALMQCRPSAGGWMCAAADGAVM